MPEQQILLLDQKISEFLEKGAIQKVEAAQGEFLTSLILSGKEGWGKPSGDQFEKTSIYSSLTSTSK